MKLATWLAGYVHSCGSGSGAEEDRWAVFAGEGLLLGSGPSRAAARAAARQSLDQAAAAAWPEETGSRDLEEDLLLGLILEEEILLEEEEE